MSVKPLYEGVKLTKKFYMGLPDRVFLVCSVGMSPMEPEFAEYVVVSSERLQQWNRILEARVDQRHCEVYQKREDFEEYLKGWRRKSDGRGWYRAEFYPNGR